jgi:acetolactate decarboxylase
MKKGFIGFVSLMHFIPYGAMAAAAENVEKNKLFHVSTMSALAQGVYDGDYRYQELMQHGDSGLGTFEGLDGEMVAIDGQFFQIKASGQLSRVSKTQIVPFAEVVYFSPSIFKTLNNVPNYASLYQLIETLPNKNIPYMIRIEGTFSKLVMRSFYKQKKPYPPLAQAAKGEAIFKMNDTKGTIIGFWFPEYWGGIAVPGFHLHFVTEDRRIGGHILELSFHEAKASLAPLHQISIHLPEIDSFAKANLSADELHSSIEKAEGGKK